jgi:hypothetical protein
MADDDLYCARSEYFAKAKSEARFVVLALRFKKLAGLRE